MEDVGATQSFVLARGFEPVGDYAALIAADGSRRLFAELSADPDLPGVRPQEAYRALLSALQPGWRLRLLQLVWPDPGPRLAFQAQVESWGGAGEGAESEGLALLREGMLVHLGEAPLPSCAARCWSARWRGRRGWPGGGRCPRSWPTTAWGWRRSAPRK